MNEEASLPTAAFDLTSGMMKSALWYYLRRQNYSGIQSEIDLPGQAGRADLIALDLLNREIALIEIKRSRGDFRRGKEKFPDYFSKAHRCYLAAPPGVIPYGEVPPGWGLLEFGRTIQQTILVIPATLHSCPAPFFDLFLRYLLEKSRDSLFFTPALERAYAKQVSLGPPKKENLL